MSTVDIEARCPACNGYQHVLREPVCSCHREAAEEERKYRLTYTGKAHPEGLAKKDIPSGFGACDCLFLASILGQPGGPGPLSVQFASLNGFKGECESLEPMQEFNIFGMFAHYLAETLPAGSQAQQICQGTFDRIQQMVLNRKAVELADGIIDAYDEALKEE